MSLPLRRSIGLLLALAGTVLLAGMIQVILLERWALPAAQWPAGIHRYTGCIHIHSLHSDGSGSLPTIVEAARMHGLDFLMITDHNTLALKDSAAGVEQPLVLVGTELSLGAGHLLAYGLDSLPEPFAEEKLGGLAAILDLVHTRQGFAQIAHPLHPKIRWKQAAIDSHIDGIELLNADTEWRDNNPAELLLALLMYPFFDQAINLLLDFPTATWELWQRALLTQQLSAIGSVDAHARIKVNASWHLRFPGYAKTFALVQNQVLLRAPLSPDPASARAQIAMALRNGNLLFGYAALGPLQSVSLWAEHAGKIYLPGDRLWWTGSSPAPVVQVRMPGQAALEAVLYNSGEPLDSMSSGKQGLSDEKLQTGRLDATSRPVLACRFELTEPGTYCVVIYQLRWCALHFRRERVPWIFANPIYVANPPSPGYIQNLRTDREKE